MIRTRDLLITNQLLYQLSYVGNTFKLVEDERIELSISGCKPDVFPLALIPQNLAPKGGIEPPTPWLTVRCNYRCATSE